MPLANKTATKTRLIGCHDCGAPVSPSARECPQCGSRDFAGPIRASRRAKRTIGAEARNDRTLVALVTILAAIGAFYGVEVSSTIVGRISFGTMYGFVGACVAVPLAFAINVTRHRI
jgi:ribosomal protein L40E